MPQAAIQNREFSPNTVATRFNVFEGTWKFWPLNPSVIKLNFSFLSFFAFRYLFDKEMQLTKELKAKDGC